jgi:hypothetical protein
MKDRQYFTHRIDMWNGKGENITEHLASVEELGLGDGDLPACRWPTDCITLRQACVSLSNALCRFRPRRWPPHGQLASEVTAR